MRSVYFLFYFLIGLLKTGQGQSINISEPQPFFMAINVSNIDTTIHWYQQNLGMILKNKLDVPERGFKQANLERSHLQIELVELSSSLSGKELLQKKNSGKSIQGFIKFDFKVKDIDNWYSYLNKKKSGWWETS